MRQDVIIFIDETRTLLFIDETIILIFIFIDETYMFATFLSNLMDSITGGVVPPPVMEAAEGRLH